MKRSLSCLGWGENDAAGEKSNTKLVFVEKRRIYGKPTNSHFQKRHDDKSYRLTREIVEMQ